MNATDTVTSLNAIFDMMCSGKENEETVGVIKALVGEVTRIKAELQNAAESGEYHPKERQLEAKKEMINCVVRVYRDSYLGCEQLVQRLHNEACEEYDF
jgi:hypothetical protein